MNDSLKRFPKKLAEGVTVRPLQASDEAPLVDFFKRMPVDERRLFKDDVTKTEVIRGWIKNLDYTNILPLLAFAGEKVVADATLHRDKAGWSRHVGKIRISIDPASRGRGLGRALVQEFIELAAPFKIAVLHAEVLDVQKGAKELFEGKDFVRVATLPQHAIDFTGRVHDVLVYALTITPPERMAPEAAVKEAEADVGGG